MTNKIEISRELAERLLTPTYMELNELRALLAAPVVKRQPVAKVVSKFGDPEAFGELEVVVLADLSKIPHDTNLYADQPAPASTRSRS